MNTTAKDRIEVTKNEPCIHCEKPDHCYRLTNVTCCKRGADPATGWFKTRKTDKEGNYYYAPIQTKPIRPKSKKEYFYKDRSGRNLVKVTRSDDGTGTKKFYQSRWENNGWATGLTDGIKVRIPIYRYAEVKQAIAEGKTIFFVEGEGVADQLWNLGLAATTTIGGSGKYRSYGSYKADLEGADLVLCPDRDEVGLKYMQDVATDFPTAKWLLAPPSEFIWEHLPSGGGADLGDWIAEGATVADIIKEIDTSTEWILSKKCKLSRDNSSIVTASGDNSFQSGSAIQAIVTIVTEILRGSLSAIDESYRLHQAYLDLGKDSGVDRKTFDQIVATERLKLEELTQDCKARLQELLSCQDATVEWEKVLPVPLARDMIRDAAIRSIDPVVIWQTLMSTCASLAGIRINLDVESHVIPSILWSATVLETGGGKTRGDSLVLEPLRKMQIEANKRYESEEKEYKQDHKDWEQNKREGDEPQPPTPRKYLFDIATIQAIVKRCADNKDHGALWSRDELEGLFNSLGQFSGNANEAIQILLAAWNGGKLFNDRLSMADSFYAEDSALSLTGGIQPGVFRKIFQDAEDANGLQARILFAVPQRLHHKRIKDYCRLSERLPLLYDWLDKLPFTMLKLSPEAEALYCELIDAQEVELSKTSNLAVRAWLSKWSTQIMRISIILHLLECFYSQRPVNSPVQRETLERAAMLGQYYRNAFQFLQEKVSDTDDLPTVLLQIQDRALQAPSGIPIRDIYRNLKSLNGLAKEAGVTVAVYTEQMCNQLANMGYGEVVRKGKSTLYVVSSKKSQTPPPVTVTIGTIAQDVDPEPKKLSPEPVTIANCHVTDNISHLETKITEFLNLPDNQPEISSPAPLKTGDRVTIHCPGSNRHGKTGKINWIANKDGLTMAMVLVDGERGKDRRFQCPIPGNEHMCLHPAQEEQE